MMEQRVGPKKVGWTVVFAYACSDEERVFLSVVYRGF